MAKAKLVCRVREVVHHIGIGDVQFLGWSNCSINILGYFHITDTLVSQYFHKNTSYIEQNGQILKDRPT